MNQSQRRADLGHEAVGTLKTLVRMGVLNSMPETKKRCEQLVAEWESTLRNLPVEQAA